MSKELNFLNFSCENAKQNVSFKAPYESILNYFSIGLVIMALFFSGWPGSAFSVYSRPSSSDFALHFGVKRVTNV